jgi:hypothetical protein
MLSYWQERLERCPELRAWLRRPARLALDGEPLPATLTLGDIPEDKAVRRALEELFPGCREANGRLKARLDDSQRDPARWLPLAGLLGLKPTPAGAQETPESQLARTLQRLKVLHPQERDLHEALAGDSQLPRYFRSSHTAPRDLLALAEAWLALRAAPSGLTLSELGAMCLNDSKALRHGPLRQQFARLLRTLTGNADADESALFCACGVIENPYTTHAVVFAPFTYQTRDGATLDWPHLLWLRGEAAVLSWRTVRTIARVRRAEPFAELTTSENAAPFHRLVEARRPSLYTGGYPNAAVLSLLRLFAAADVSARHWGDTDLDGYRIAELVARAIPADLYRPPAGAPCSLRRLTHDQHRRLSQFIDAHPSFPFLAELRHTLAHGWLEQEQSVVPADNTFNNRPAPADRPPAAPAPQPSTCPC